MFAQHLIFQNARKISHKSKMKKLYYFMALLFSVPNIYAPTFSSSVHGIILYSFFSPSVTKA